MLHLYYSYNWHTMCIYTTGTNTLEDIVQRFEVVVTIEAKTSDNDRAEDAANTVREMLNLAVESLKQTCEGGESDVNIVDVRPST